MSDSSTREKVLKGLGKALAVLGFAVIAALKLGAKKFIIKAAVIAGLVAADAVIGSDSTAAMPPDSAVAPQLADVPVSAPTPAAGGAAGASAAASPSVVQAGVAQASMPGAVAKNAARAAVAKTNEHIAAETGDSAARPGQPNAATPPAGNAAAKPAAATPPAAPAAAPTGSPSAITVVMREQFVYEVGGRRDPFVSLMRSSQLRPALQDLRLTGILFDHTGRRPVAIMREAGTNEQYRVTTGMSLGRMHVEEIRPKSVIFIIEEFGYSRRDSLVLLEPTRMRTP